MRVVCARKEGRKEGRKQVDGRRTSKQNRLFNNPFSGTPSPHSRTRSSACVPLRTSHANRFLLSSFELQDFCRENRGEQKRRGGVGRAAYVISYKVGDHATPEDGHRCWHLAHSLSPEIEARKRSNPSVELSQREMESEDRPEIRRERARAVPESVPRKRLR